MKRTVSALTFISALIVLLLLVASVPSLKAAIEVPQVQWEKTYGEPQSVSSAMARTSDGGYIIAGGDNFTYGYRGTTPIPFLVKTDQYGNLEWERNYDTLWSGTLGQSIMQTADLGYLIFSYDGMVKTASKGNIQWNNTLSSLAGIQTSDGGYLLLTGSTDENGAYIAILIKTDGHGNIVWNQTFGGENTIGTRIGVAGNSIAETTDGGYAITGTWELDCWLLKTDSNGNTLLNKTYRFDFGAGQYGGSSIAQTKDSGFIIAGSKTGSINLSWLVKTDSQGSVEWVHKDYSGFFHSIAQTSDGGYFGVGGVIGDPSSLAWVIRTDASGNVLWNETYGRTSSIISNRANSIAISSDGGYVVTGTVNDSIWMIKFAPETIAPTNGESPPFQTTWIVVALIMAVVVGISALVYLKKRKH